jgi:LPS export ABC transporter protein LptC
MRLFIRLLTKYFFSFIVCACSGNQFDPPVEYEGPVKTAEYLSVDEVEYGKLKRKTTSSLVYEYANQDKVFPKGIFIEVFDDSLQVESTVKADYAKYLKQQNEWHLTGDVQLHNIKRGQRLTTERLVYKLSEKKVSTDAFVTIQENNHVIYGTGLEANPFDLSDYTLAKVHGDIEVKDQ